MGLFIGVFTGMLIGLFVVGIFGISHYFMRQATYPKVLPYEETFEFEAKENGVDVDAFKKLDKMELYIPGHGGHQIHGFLIKGTSNKTIILCHGYTLSLAGTIKYSKMFIDKGYSVFLYDHRNHGLSTKSFTSFGHFESEDLRRVIKALRKRDKSIKFGLMGESLGGATVLQYIAKYDDVDFVIADCPFADAHDIFQYRMKYDYKVAPKFIIHLTRVLQGWSFKYASVKGRLKNVTTPILFIHGEDDMYIPKAMTEALYEEKGQASWLYIAPGARHAKSYTSNPLAYEKKVMDFLKIIRY